jgi:hypothetical protein
MPYVPAVFIKLKDAWYIHRTTSLAEQDGISEQMRAFHLSILYHFHTCTGQEQSWFAP